MKDEVLSLRLKGVYEMLLEHQQKYPDTSHVEIARRMKKTKPTIRRYLTLLEQKGVIEKTRRIDYINMYKVVKNY